MYMNTQRVAVCATALFGSFAMAQTMTYNVSVYNTASASADHSTIYGTSTSSDNSIKGSCVYSNYTTQSQLVMPDGTTLSVGSNSGMTSSVQAYFNDEWGTYLNRGTVTLKCSCAPWATPGGGGPNGTVIVNLTPVQHDYPRSPLDVACRVASWYDAIRGVQRSAHHALDIVKNGPPGSTPYGTPVYAMEAGRVVAMATGKPPAGVPTRVCMGQHKPGNYVTVRADGDTYNTMYFHITPAAGIAVGCT
jgi:murein DD-endopeptidase MepM/ murein hydrolase activator NlpD